MKKILVNVTINGREIAAQPVHSVIQALWYAGNPRIKGVGCLDGVCGSCRIMLRRTESSDVVVALACQTNIEEGMQVIFPSFFEPTTHHYQLSDLTSPRDVQPRFNQVFPEVSQCRSCGGCTESCPKGIEVEQGVHLAADGKFREAGDLFVECVMCDMCVTSCPESISPSHVGLFSRRITAYFDIQPPNLMERLEQLRQGNLTVVVPDSSTVRGN